MKRLFNCKLFNCNRSPEPEDPPMTGKEEEEELVKGEGVDGEDGTNPPSPPTGNEGG